jgi:hypothetical protein
MPELPSRPPGACPSGAWGRSFGMPTVLRVGPYRCFFFAGDRGEPRHVHVEREASRAKYWLEPVRLQESGGFRGAELNRLAALVAEHRDELVRAWDDYFGD